ncbi:hypothetical protein, partial [Rhodovulum sulfidophilum]
MTLVKNGGGSVPDGGSTPDGGNPVETPNDGPVVVDPVEATPDQGAGNYSLVLGNVVTSAGYKTVDHSEGALSQGIRAQAQDVSLVDNIIAHLADPNNAEEQVEKVKG